MGLIGFESFPGYKIGTVPALASRGHKDPPSKRCWRAQGRHGRFQKFNRHLWPTHLRGGWMDERIQRVQVVALVSGRRTHLATPHVFERKAAPQERYTASRPVMPVTAIQGQPMRTAGSHGHDKVALLCKRGQYPKPSRSLKPTLSTTRLHVSPRSLKRAQILSVSGLVTV